MKPVIMGQAVKFAGKLVDFGAPVLKVLSAAGKHLVLIESWELPQPDYSRGVYAYSDAGERLWQIEGLSGEAPPFKFSWVNIWIDENGGLMALDFNEMDFPIDIETGRIVKKLKERGK